MRPASALLLSVLALPLAGCPTEPPPRVKEPSMVDKDEWAGIPKTPEWLHATSDFNGPHKEECEHVLDWVKAESDCQASLCEHGRDLAKDWLARCEKLAPKESIDAVKELSPKLFARADEKATACGKQAEDMLRDGCGKEAACRKATQRWATRCAKSEKSPLVVRALARVVERTLDTPETIDLDTRTCDEIAPELRASATCKDRFTCGDAIAKVELYQGRCETPEDPPPTIGSAVLELSVFSGALKSPPPIKTRQGSPAIAPADVPVALADGSGAVLAVCDERVLDLASYIVARKACQGGKILIARAFKGAKGVEARVGSLEFPSDVVFSLRYPTLVAAGENDARDQENLKVFDASLTKVQTRAMTAPPDAARELIGALALNASSLRRTASFRAALATHDAGLAPALQELARAKVKAMKGKLSPADVIGLFQRAQTRALADVGLDGVVVPAAPSPASMLDTSQLLPKAMRDYLDALKPGVAIVKTKKPKPVVVAAATQHGVEQAAACGAAEKRLQESKSALISCGFGLETCDETRVEGLAKALDDARLAAEAAFRDLDTERSGVAASSLDTLNQAAEAAGCREPWW